MRVVHSQQQNVLVRFTGSLALVYTVIEMTPSVSFVSLLLFSYWLNPNVWSLSDVLSIE